MGTPTLSQRAPDRPTASTYWRRRFVALVIGLSLLALITWAVSGLMGTSAPGANPGAIRPVHGTLPPSPQPHASGGPAPHTSSSPAGAARHQHARRAPALHPCAASDVVLSISSAQASYSQRQSPEFSVNVVSVASQTCTFNIGARHVWLQISAGPVKIWSSAECAEGEASLVTELRRGVPTVIPIGWNEQISGPGCPGPGTNAAAGSYAAVAYDGSATSNSLVFRIS